MDNKNHYLPRQRKPKATGKETSSNPTGKTQQSSQSPCFLIKSHIEQGIDQSQQEPKIKNQEPRLEKPNLRGGGVESRRKVQKNQGGEEDWPHKDYVYQNIGWVAVVCPIEGKMPLKIKQPRSAH